MNSCSANLSVKFAVNGKAQRARLPIHLCCEHLAAVRRSALRRAAEGGEGRGLRPGRDLVAVLRADPGAG